MKEHTSCPSCGARMLISKQFLVGAVYVWCPECTKTLEEGDKKE